MWEHQNIKIFLIKDTLRIGNEVLVINKVRNTLPWTNVVSNFKDEDIIGIFCKKELQKSSQTDFRIVKVINRKDNRLYAKWKSHDSLFNTWIHIKDIAWGRDGIFFEPYEHSSTNKNLNLIYQTLERSSI